jgi:hypothetical protein
MATIPPIAVPIVPTSAPSRGGVDISAFLPIIQLLGRRGPATTEFWAPVVGAVLSLIFAKIGIPGDQAVQVVTVAAPAIAGVLYALARTFLKSSVAKVLRLP